MTTTYEFPMFDRLEPLTPWNGGMLAGSDVVTLEDAARFASKHAGIEITPADFLRAAGRGQIPMRAICPRAATMEPCRETDKPLTMPENCIPTLPFDACKALSNTGLATWRTIDGFEKVDSFGEVLGRFTRWKLPDTEPDIVTTPDDCRLTGWDVHKLADAFIEAPAQNIATSEPLVALGAQRGYVLTLPSGQTHVQFGELAHLIADALWPDAGADDSRMTYGFSRVNLDAELVQAVNAGTLQVKDPLTFGPQTFPVGNALLSALVTIDDLREFVAGRGLTVETAKTQTMTPSPAPEVADGASSVIHSTKVRRDALTPVIELAQKNCRNPQDTAEVWAALLVLAETKHAPLRGATEDGLQYLKGGAAAFFNRDALRKRLDR